LPKHNRYIAVAVFTLCALLALFVVLERRSAGDGDEITPEALQARLGQGDTTLFLLDVRTPEEYLSETGHLENSLLIPVQQLKTRMAELEPYRGKTIVAYCRTGRRSAQAADMLRGEGFSALNMTGGIASWNQKMLPVAREDGP